MRYRTALRATLASALTVVLAACGGDSTAPASPSSASVAGAYTLRSINGSPLPYTVQNGNSKVDVVASTLTMTDGGTWSETVTVRVSLNGGNPTTQTSASSGSYLRVGTSFTLATNSSANYLSGTFDGKNTLSMVSGPLSFVYSK